MDYIGVQSIKQNYAQTLLESGYDSRSFEIYQKSFEEPIFEGLAIHPETEIVKDNINNAFKEIAIDFACLNQELQELANRYWTLVEKTVLRLNAVEDTLQTEEDRIRDINIICNNYNQFSSIISITGDDVEGDYYYDNNAFTGPQIVNDNTPTLSVLDVAGNGYEGNNYVFGRLTDTSERSNLVDENILTTYEYSRLTTQSEDDKFNYEVNLDNEEALCTITLQSSCDINAVNLISCYGVVIEDLLISTDSGSTYQSTLDDEIELFSKEHRYDKPDYAYQTGIIAFSPAQYIKIRLRSNGTTSDLIAEDIEDETTVHENVKRHVARIDLINADNSTYEDGYFTTGELISTPVDSIAIFANEYVPSYFYDDGDDYIQYILTVNGIDYEVAPINSGSDKKKVIRFADYYNTDDYVTYIKESIKTASLTVNTRCYNDASPYISNLKICLGSAVE